jgi:hypothetical protein
VRGARDIAGYFLIWHFRDTRNSNEQGEVEKNHQAAIVRSLIPGSIFSVAFAGDLLIPYAAARSMGRQKHRREVFAVWLRV